jgi:hypothetical protein
VILETNKDVAVGQQNAAMLWKHAVVSVWLVVSGSYEKCGASHGTPDNGRPQSEAISTEHLLIRTWLGRAPSKDDQAGGTHYARLTSGGGGGRFHGRI